MKLESRAMVSPEGTFSFPVGHIDSPCLPMKIMQIIYLIIVYTFLEFKGPFSVKVHSIFLFRAILRHETNLLEFTTRTNLLKTSIFAGVRWRVGGHGKCRIMKYLAACWLDKNQIICCLSEIQI